MITVQDQLRDAYLPEIIYYTSYKDKCRVISSSSLKVSDSQKTIVQKQRYGRANLGPLGSYLFV